MALTLYVCMTCHRCDDDPGTPLRCTTGYGHEWRKLFGDGPAGKVEFMSQGAYEDVEGDNRCDAHEGFIGGKQCRLQRNHKEDHRFEWKETEYLLEHPIQVTQKAYFQEFANICAEMVELTKRKNSDYAESADAFANFKTIEQITGGRITCEAGIVVRITDKLKRIGSLLSRPAKVLDEKITDTVLDMAVYSVILLIYLRRKRNEQLPAADTTKKRD